MTMALSDYHLYSIIGLRPDVVFPAFSLSRFSSVFQRVFPGPAGRRAQLGARVAGPTRPRPQSNPRPAPRSDTTERPKTYKITESDSSTWPERSTRTVKPQHPRPRSVGCAWRTSCAYKWIKSNTLVVLLVRWFLLVVRALSCFRVAGVARRARGGVRLAQAEGAQGALVHEGRTHSTLTTHVREGEVGVRTRRIDALLLKLLDVPDEGGTGEAIRGNWKP